MRKLGSDININEVIEDQTSEFCIRDFRIGNTHFERPEKSLDASQLTRDTFDSIKDNFKFREGTKAIRSYQTISKLYHEYEYPMIRSFFFKKGWSTIPTVMNFTLNFNPLINQGINSEMKGFFDRYHAYSDLFLTIPNIRTVKGVRVKGPDGKEKTVKKTMVDTHDYITFVELSYNYLNTKNNKPIFVPISLRMKLGQIKELVGHYLKNEHYYYWVDFDAKSINQNQIGVLKHICNILREAGYYDKTVFYFTNIKREISMNAKNDQSEASDVLASLMGANLIGVNREPSFPFKKPIPISPSTDLNLALNPIPEPIPSHYKSRLLDSGSYYYVRTNNPDFFEKSKYVPVNALRLNREFENQTNQFLIDMNIRDYLNKKKMLTSYQNGNLLKALVTKKPILKKIGDFW